MSGPTEFTLESVRQYMLARDGRVTNHELVKYFKAWLTHPTEKDIARQKFKEYVNTLATIKQENGEKYLVLKKKFYPNFDDDDGGGNYSQRPYQPMAMNHHARQPESSLLDEVMAGYNAMSSSTSRRVLPQTPVSSQFYPGTAPGQMPGLPMRHHYQQPPMDYGLPPAPPQQSYYSPTHSQRSSYASHSRGSHASNSPSSDMMVRAPPPYRQPPSSLVGNSNSFRQLPNVPNDLGLPVAPPPASSFYARSVSQGYNGAPPPNFNYGPHSSTGLPNPNRSGGLHESRSYQTHLGSHASLVDTNYHHSMRSLSTSSLPPDDAPPPPLPRRNGEQPALYSSSGYSSGGRASTASTGSLHDRGPPAPPPKSLPPSSESQQQPPPLPTRNQNMKPEKDSSSSAASLSPSEDKENSSPPNEPPQTQQQSRQPQPPTDEKISVKERTKTFNRMASEVDLGTLSGPQSRKVSTASTSSSMSSSAAAIKRRNSRAAGGYSSRSSSQHRLNNNDDKSDTSSITTIDQNLRSWMVKSAQGDYHTMMKMLMDDPRLAKHRDFTSGFTALHWAAKHGDLNMVKLLAGNYHVDVNVKSHGGYTPLHLACQFGKQDVFDLLVKAYGADPMIRDNHGKTPRQYMMTQEQSTGLSLSSDTFRQLKDRRRNRRQAEKNPSILRFGSLSVKVKKTTEAFNNYFSERKTSWGETSTENGMNSLSSSTSDSQKMPPPKFAPIKKRKSKRSVDYGVNKSAPSTPTDRSPIKEELSDSEYGFDSQWSNGAQ